MAAKDEMQQKRDENVPPEGHRSEGARSQLPRPAGTSALPFRRLNNSSPQSSHRVTGKDRLRQFCRQVFRDSPSPPPLSQSLESPQLVSADSAKPKPAGHVYTVQASPKAAATSECSAQHQQLSCIPKATSGPRTYEAGGDYGVLHTTEHFTRARSKPHSCRQPRDSCGTTDSSDTDISSGISHARPLVVPDMFSPDFDEYRELLRQDRIECYGRDFIQSPVFADNDLSPGLTPPPAVPLPESNSMHDARQIIAVPLPDSPAHYTDSSKQLEGSHTAEFQLPVSVVWKRRRQHGPRRSSVSPPRASPESCIRHAEASPQPEERDSSDGGRASGSGTSRGGDSPGVIASDFRTPDFDDLCRRIRAEIAESYCISPRLSPAESVERVAMDVAKHRSVSPLLSPANSIKAAVPAEMRDGAMTSSPVPSPPTKFAWARTGPTVSLAARHRLSTVLECSQEISHSTVCGTTALGTVLEESLLMDAREPTLVGATFGACMPTSMNSQLVEMGDEPPADRMSESLTSFIEHERMIMEEFDINSS